MMMSAWATEGTSFPMGGARGWGRTMLLNGGIVAGMWAEFTGAARGSEIGDQDGDSGAASSSGTWIWSAGTWTILPSRQMTMELPSFLWRISASLTPWRNALS